jgi:hypothetical protein
VVLVGVFNHLASRIIAGRDLVHVDVEGHHDAIYTDELEVGETRFFARLAESDLLNMPLTVGVPAKLKPTIEFSVMRQKRAVTV